MALETPAPARHHRPWVRWARLVISAGLLAVLVTKIDTDDLVPSHRSLPGTLAFLFSGILLMGFSFVLASWRWQRVLAVYGKQVPLRTLLKHYLAGQFVGNALPSTVGGDVLRVSRCSRDVGSSEIAFASVVLERLTGFFALPLLSFIGFAARSDLLDVDRSWIAIAVGGGTLLVLALILLLAASPRLAGRFKDHENWMRYIGIVHVGVDRLRRDKRDAVGALGAAIAYQVSVVLAVYCAVHTIGDPRPDQGLLAIPNGAVLAFVPAVAMIQVLPISVSGLGVREGMLALLLHPLGVPTGQAVAVGLLWYMMMLFVSLAGAPAFAMGHGDRRHQRVAASAAAERS
jgi:glycosyltransferase 2 family protein